MHLLGFRFAPRIRDLGETKLFIPKGDIGYDALRPMVSIDKLNVKAIRAHWDDILRLATSIRQGTVTASLMLRKLGSYPRQNGLAVALREPWLHCVGTAMRWMRTCCDTCRRWVGSTST